MSDSLDEVESIAESLQKAGLPAYWRMKDEDKIAPVIETEKATLRDVADALETTAAETGRGFEALVSEMESMRKEIRQLQNHRHPADELFSGKPVL